MALAALRRHEGPAVRAAVERVPAPLEQRRGVLGASPRVAVRGRGARWGVEPGGPYAESEAARAMAGAVTGQLLKRGILLLPGGPGGNVLTLTPPFEIADEEIAFAAGEIAECLAAAA
jgi:4-aminobutyrate aminotransferase-like enzyme